MSKIHYLCNGVSVGPQNDRNYVLYSGIWVFNPTRNNISVEFTFFYENAGTDSVTREIPPDSVDKVVVTSNPEQDPFIVIDKSYGVRIASSDPVFVQGTYEYFNAAGEIMPPNKLTFQQLISLQSVNRLGRIFYLPDVGSSGGPQRFDPTVDELQYFTILNPHKEEATVKIRGYYYDRTKVETEVKIAPERISHFEISSTGQKYPCNYGVKLISDLQVAVQQTRTVDKLDTPSGKFKMEAVFTFMLNPEMSWADDEEIKAL